MSYTDRVGIVEPQKAIVAPDSAIPTSWHITPYDGKLVISFLPGGSVWLGHKDAEAIAKALMKVVDKGKDSIAAEQLAKILDAKSEK